MKYFSKLNSLGEKKAIEYLTDLSEQKKYTNDTIHDKEHKRFAEQSEQKPQQIKTGRMLHQKIVAFGGDNSEEEISEDELIERFKAIKERKKREKEEKK